MIALRGHFLFINPFVFALLVKKYKVFKFFWAKIIDFS